MPPTEGDNWHHLGGLVVKAGYEAIIVTVDLGEWKDADRRDRFALPKEMLVKHLRAYFTLPLVAIGGIQEAQAAAVARCGVEGLAVVSAICGARDVQAAARGLRRAIDASVPVRAG